MKKRASIIIALVLAAAMFATGCGGGAASSAAPAAEEKKEEAAPAAEEKKEEAAPAAEEKKEEAPAAEEKKEEAAAAEEKKEEAAPAAAGESITKSEGFTIGDYIEGGGKQGDKHYKIGISIGNLSLPFFEVISSETKKQIEAIGDEVVAITDGGGNQQTQIDQIEDFLVQDIDILLLCPAYCDSILPSLVACKDAGVPVISWDMEPFDTEYLASHVASDNYDCGVAVGKYIAEHVPDGTKFIIVSNPTTDSMTNRLKGMLDTCEKAGRKYNYVEIIWTGEQDPLTTMEDALQANPDATAFYAPYEGVSLAAAAAVESSGMDVQVFGVDASPSEKAAIKAGQLVATGAQSPYKLANQLVVTMYDVLEGRKVEPRYLIPSFCVDASNVDEYGTTDWQ